MRPEWDLQRVIILVLAAITGYMLCGGILRMIDPFMDVSVTRFFSALTGLVFAAIAWRVA